VTDPVTDPKPTEPDRDARQVPEPDTEVRAGLVPPQSDAADEPGEDSPDHSLDGVEREAPGLLVRLPWIIFQGLTIGLPLAGFVIFGAWLLRLAGVALPWPPAIGLALGALSGMVSLAAFQTLEHDARRADPADPTDLSHPTHDRSHKAPPSTLARVTAGIILGNLVGVPIVVAILVIGVAIGYFFASIPRAATIAGVAAGLAYYTALAMGIASGTRR
jgi:hypothetical protein